MFSVELEFIDVSVSVHGDKGSTRRRDIISVNLNSKKHYNQSEVVLTSSTPLVLHIVVVVAQSTKFLWAKDQLEAQSSSHNKIWTMAILTSCR